MFLFVCVAQVCADVGNGDAGHELQPYCYRDIVLDNDYGADGGWISRWMKWLVG